MLLNETPSVYEARTSMTQAAATAQQARSCSGRATPMISGRVAIALQAQKMQTSTRKLSTTTSFAAATSWWDKAFPAPKTCPAVVSATAPCWASIYDKLADWE